MSNDNHSDSSAVNTYRRHVTERQKYIDRCAVVHSELEAMDKRAVEEIIEAHTNHVQSQERESLRQAVQHHLDYYEVSSVKRDDDYTSVVQGVRDDIDIPVTARDSDVNCNSCGWKGMETDLITHPSGGLGCPNCITTEGLNFTN